MREVKTVNGLLWVLNALLGAGIVFFSCSYLLFPAETSFLDGFDPVKDTGSARTSQARRVGDGTLKTLMNPVKPGQHGNLDAPTARLFRAQLMGTLPGAKDARRGVAFIKSTGKNVELVAYIGEEIRKDGKPYDEFRGWKLVEVAKEKAVFSDGVRKETLTMDRSAGAPRSGARSGAGSARSGTPYTKDQYSSQLLASSRNRHVWGLDPKEIAWAKANYLQIMDRDFQVTPFAGGGLKVASVRPGSIGAARGILAGDVIKNVSGQGIRTIADLKMLMNNPQMRRQSSISLTVLRAGKPLVIEYRPLPPGRRRR